MRNNDTAVRYLLGELPEKERDAFEDRMFAEQDAADALEAAEQDLIDAYLRHELGALERKSFENAYFQHPGRRKKVEAARILEEKLFSTVLTEAVVSHESIWGFLKIFRSPAFVAACLLLVMGAAISMLFIRNYENGPDIADTPPQISESPEQTGTDGQPPLTKEPPANQTLNASKPDKGKTTAPETRSVFAVTLFPATRGSERPTLVIPSNTSRVVLRLVHDNEKEFLKYRVVVQDNRGHRILSRDFPVSAERTLPVSISSSRMRPGSYEAAVVGVGPNGRGEELMFYEFVVSGKGSTSRN